MIDEADRLLAQSFQDWLVQVLAAIRSPIIYKSSPDSQDDLCPHPDPVAPNVLQQLPYPHLPTFLTEEHENSCQKLLFSATLTRDPGKIAALELRKPKYFIVQKGKDSDTQDDILDVVTEKFSMPSTLRVTHPLIIRLDWLFCANYNQTAGTYDRLRLVAKTSHVLSPRFQSERHGSTRVY